MSRPYKPYNPFANDPWKPEPKPQPRPMVKQTCPQCKGSGQIFKNSVWEWGWKKCPACDGTGTITFRSPPWKR